QATRIQQILASSHYAKEDHRRGPGHEEQVKNHVQEKTCLLPKSKEKKRPPISLRFSLHLVKFIFLLSLVTSLGVERQEWSDYEEEQYGRLQELFLGGSQGDIMFTCSELLDDITSALEGARSVNDLRGVFTFVHQHLPLFCITTAGNYKQDCWSIGSTPLLSTVLQCPVSISVEELTLNLYMLHPETDVKPCHRLKLAITWTNN
ncbi:unnamed protein product, partial [Meganyctiphanes norvegica]